MKCLKCQTINPDDSKFCKECAAPLTKVKGVSFTVTLKAPKAGFSKGTVIASKYKIIKEIGRGGMGVVYKAEDTRLDRTVALKFLSSELTQDEEAKIRFVQEAKAAAALNHPNICTIYEVDEADGQTFISMEYIEGHTLKEKLLEKRLNIDDAVDIAIQVAHGLDKAHSKGIIHRDIKPANIMINDDGRAKITDFGLAKLSWGVDLTKTSTLMGTVAYMSPEQARGDKVDHRTDIWSLGALMHEMLVGERPFKKSHEQALIYSILNDEPRSVSLLRSEVPGYLEGAILKALEKDVTKRFQNVYEFIEAVIHPIAASTPKDEKSIAVLPFTNMSNDPEQEYFCDGIAEEIINSLTKLKDLHVVARTSAFSFKGQNVPVQDIGKQLNVGYVLEGSVRKSGERLRVTAQLIDVADGYHLWSERYDRELKDIFAIQDEISLAIVDKLRLRLFKEEKAQLIKHHTSNVDVYNLYLRGRYLWQKFTLDDVKKSQEYLEQTIELDPDFALPYAELAGGVYVQLAGGGQDVLAPKEAIPKAKALLEKAIEKDPNNGEALAYLGLIHTWYEYDWKAAEEVLKRANEVDPGSVISHNCYAFFLNRMGRLEEAIEEQIRAIKLDPLSPLMYNNAGHFCYDARQYDQALEYCKQALDLNPLLPITRWVLGKIYIQKQNYRKAIELIEPLVSDLTYTYGFLGYAYGLAKMAEEAGEVIDVLNRLKEEYQVEPLMAMVYCGLGETEKAFEYLELSTDKLPIAWSKPGFVVTHGMFGVDPIWDPLRRDERFVEILKKIGLSHLAAKKAAEASSISTDLGSQRPEKSIVVLPFDDVSPDKDNEYFSDGLTEEIISDLSHIHGLLVISRSSAMTFKGTKKTIPEIAKAVNVRYVLEGSVRKAGNALRITAQLIDSTNDAHLWAEKYSGTLDDVFDIQEKVSRSIVAGLKMKLAPTEQRKISEHPVANASAYDCYLRAKHEIAKWTEPALDRALHLLETALKLTGDNAALFAGLAQVYLTYAAGTFRTDEETLEKAGRYAEKALRLDPELAVGHYILATLALWQQDCRKFFIDAKRAVSLDPNDPDAVMWITFGAAYTGNSSISRPYIERLIQIDPLNSQNYVITGIQEYYECRFEEALEASRKAFELDPENIMSRYLYIASLMFTGSHDEANRLAEQWREDMPGHAWVELILASLYSARGKKAESQEILSEKTQHAMWRGDPAGVLTVAQINALNGETEESLKWLEHAVDMGFINYPLFSELDPFLENIRGEPRFKKLMERVKYEWEKFEVKG